MTDKIDLAELLKGTTPGPWFPGCQNDALFIVAGRPPAINNDYPWHDAPRVAVARVFGPTESDCLPVDADHNGALLAAAPGLAAEVIALRAELATLRAHAVSLAGALKPFADTDLTTDQQGTDFAWDVLRARTTLTDYRKAKL